MTKITIPKETKNDTDLVAVSEGAYKEFLAWQKKTKAKRTFTPTKADKEALAEGRKNFKKGNYISAGEL